MIWPLVRTLRAGSLKLLGDSTVSLPLYFESEECVHLLSQPEPNSSKKVACEAYAAGRVIWSKAEATSTVAHHLLLKSIVLSKTMSSCLLLSRNDLNARETKAPDARQAHRLKS